MIEVIGAGLPRTGTLSLKAALERLGFGPCYHMFEIFEHLELVGRWAPGVPGSREGWDQVFAGYRSTLDWPASYFWRAQAEAYPRAKVVLTVRDPKDWYASFREMVALRVAAAHDPSPDAVAFQARFAPLQPLLARIARDLFGGDLRFPAELPAEADAVRAYDRYVAEVRDGLPAERLLVFDVREGWAPLCAFLGVAQPDGEPFPRLNDLEATRRRFQELT